MAHDPMARGHAGGSAPHRAPVRRSASSRRSFSPVQHVRIIPARESPDSCRSVATPQGRSDSGPGMNRCLVSTKLQQTWLDPRRNPAGRDEPIYPGMSRRNVRPLGLADLARPKSATHEVQYHRPPSDGRLERDFIVIEHRYHGGVMRFARADVEPFDRVCPRLDTHTERLAPVRRL